MAHGSPSYTTNCAELVRLRENAGWSQREFAARCKKAGRPVDASQIARYETGRSRPRPAALAVMAEVLKCSPDDLVIRSAVSA